MFLLDTDTLIYAFKGLPGVVDNIRIHADAPKALSVISYGELIYGAHKSTRVSANLARVHRLRDIFPVIETSSSILECFGSIKAGLSKKGITVDDCKICRRMGLEQISRGNLCFTNTFCPVHYF